MYQLVARHFADVVDFVAVFGLVPVHDRLMVRARKIQ